MSTPLIDTSEFGGRTLVLAAEGGLASVDIALIIGAAVLLLLLVVVARFLLRRRPPAPPAELPPTAVRPTVPDREARAQVEAAAAAVERAKAEREAAEERIRREQEARRQREEAARQKAEAEARAREEAEARAAELQRKAQEEESAEAREAAQREARIAAQEAERRRREEQEALRKAEYEARKTQEAEERARKKAEEEQARLAELEAARARAEEEARAAALAEAEKQRRIEAERGRTLAEGLARTRGGFVARLAQLVGASTTLDDEFLGELEEILFTADIGVRTAENLLEHVREKLKSRELGSPEKVRAALKSEIERILSIDGQYPVGGMPEATTSPQVVMIVGVNGSGKTTTLGKLSFQQRVAGRSVLLGAGDTFRAAAAEQLEVWAERAEVPLVKGPADGDPAAVCFDAVKTAVDEGKDLCLLDTAGRLHTKTPLMDELKKVRRVVDKAMPGAPHEVWLVVDGTTGQNALMQARLFHEALGLTGLILTKLDGTAKGGVIIGVCDELKVPVRYVGVGEQIGDLKPFNAKEFVDALFAE